MAQHKKTGKGTPTWPAVRKKAHVSEEESESESFPPLQAFPPLQPLSSNSNHNAADGSRSGHNSRGRSCSRSRSRACSSRGGSTTTHPSKVPSLITQAEENVVKEMAGLILGGGCSAHGARDDGKDDDHYSDDAVRPQVLFGDGNGGAACGGADGDVGIAESDEEDGAGGAITSPWDLPAPFMLSATGLLAASGVGSSGDNASTMPRTNQQQPQQQQHLGKGAPSSSFFSFSTNSPARRCPPTSLSAGGNYNTSATAADGLSMTTTPIPNQHNALQHQAHQPLPPEQFRNHQYHLNINNGGVGAAGAAYEYGGGAAPHHPTPPGPAFTSSMTSGSASIGGGSGPMGFPSGAPCYGRGGGPPPLSGPLYQNGIGGGGGGGGGVRYAPDTFDIGGLRYPLRNVPLLYSPCDVFSTGQYPSHWQNFQRKYK